MTRKRLLNATATILVLAATILATSLLSTACLSPITPTAGATSSNTNTATASPEITVNAPSPLDAHSRPHGLAAPSSQP